MNGALAAVVEKTTTDVLKLKELDETVVKLRRPGMGTLWWTSS